MSALDDAIDRLYQQPLTTFTHARDALAKQSGKDGVTIRRLQKPSVAAWAVNQVFWHRPKVLERLKSASDRVRAAHERSLAGRNSDVALAEASHRAAIVAAVDEARALLERAGEQASDATLLAVDETFQTIVWSPLDGRLIRPRKPTGAEAIAALLEGPSHEIKPAAKVLPIRPTAESKIEVEKRDARDHRRRVAEAEKAVRAARIAEEKAEAQVARATANMEQATREQAKLEAALETATAAARESRAALTRARDTMKSTTIERQRLEAALAAL